ncbi:Myb-like DNA-binding domain containing protein [Trichomonas vaginalis G3]|uniref:Myb-like DNA-binding domain containing protein n=1 Tax=Trichomonas vaginalis (strain ATCC PRA-98 / G3) TaxID=412133 RepID=A2E3E9_TRIV3|nr:RNA polymerase II transcription regulator recruiting protein [Trichomonas vaginalis G3]EAY12840.1 Myb-like DNA-binding domain containing protein [Trichomonas vaginalis G3]KAI5488503.1 RNA polymerase II transcription regulator recruiting protein [Trichomonas vaginalis G3]|eukprot:XP_001325063.1 Myb-like DNA-binding domain containing protein [Trichomonas vaginalis G3]
MNRSTHHPIIKRKWSADEDELLLSCVHKSGPYMWDQIAKHIPGRSGKQCRERWITVLDPSINRDEWSAEEDAKLLILQSQQGNKWASIASSMPGRTAISAKNRFKFLKRRNARRERAIAKESNTSTSQEDSPAPELNLEIFEFPAHMRIRLL